MFSFEVAADASRRDLSMEGASWRQFGLLRCLARCFSSTPTPHHPVLSVEDFEAGIQAEQRRLTRSGRPFVVVRIAGPGLFEDGRHTRRRVLGVLGAAARQTDLVGWIEPGKILGVLCTELGTCDVSVAGTAISKKFGNSLRYKLAADSMRGLQMSLDLYPSKALTGVHFEALRAAQLIP